METLFIYVIGIAVIIVIMQIYFMGGRDNLKLLHIANDEINDLKNQIVGKNNIINKLQNDTADMEYELTLAINKLEGDIAELECEINLANSKYTAVVENKLVQYLTKENVSTTSKVPEHD